jgi:hypothetical protein
MPTFTRDEYLSAANALNTEAKRFDELIATATVGDAQTRRVWADAAAQHRELAIKMVDASKIAVERDDAQSLLLTTLEVAEQTLRNTLAERGYKDGDDVSEWADVVRKEVATLAAIRAVLAKAGG